MKKFVLLFALTALFLSCEKDNKSVYEIVNLSGVDWYETQAWYSNDANADADFTGYDKVGTVMIGESVKVSTDNSHVLIKAKSSTGNLVMSQRVRLSGHNVTIKQSDLFPE